MRTDRILPVCLGTLALVAGSVAMMGGTAAAASPKGVPGQRVASAPSAKVVAGGLEPDGATPPAGYSIQSAVFEAANGEQTEGTVACPAGTVPWGGGAVISSSSLHANLNTSESNGASWVVFVNNASGSETDVTVYAVCADAPADYQIVDGTTAVDPAGARAGNFAACPKHTVSLGAGGFLESAATSVNLNGIEPILSERIYNVEAYVNNASASNSDFYAQVICGKKPMGYSTKTATADNPAGEESSAIADCPRNRFVVGGGVVSSSIDLATNVNTTAPHGEGAWIAFMNNGSASDASVTTYAICVR